MRGQAIALNVEEREELERRARSRKGRADDARVARVLLMLEDEATYSMIQEALGCSAPFISKWKKRFHAEKRSISARLARTLKSFIFE